LAALAALVGGAAGIGWLVMGALGAVMAGALILLAGASLYACASRCALRLAGASPVSGDSAPELQRLIERLARQKERNSAGAAPRLYWLPGDAPNILTTGRGAGHAAIALTPGLPAVLERDELTGLLVRELASLEQADAPWQDISAALAGGLMCIAGWPDRFRPPAESGEEDGLQWARKIAARVGAAMRIVLASSAAGVVRVACSAERIYAADAAGAQLLGDPLPLARALAKLAAGNSARPACDVNPGLVHQFIVAPFVEEPLQTLLCTHPPLAARLQRLTEQALEPSEFGASELAGRRKAEVRGVQPEARGSTGAM